MEHLFEYLIGGKKIGRASRYNFHPQTKEELQEILKELIKERGLEDDFNELTELIAQSNLNSKSYSDKVGTAVEYANKRKDPTARHFSRWNMMDSHFNGAYETQMNMQYAIRNMVVECQQALNNAKDGE